MKWLRKLFSSVRPCRLAERVQKIDEQNREVRHDLKNIQFRTDALSALITGMREDETWRREKKGEE